MLASRSLLGSGALAALVAFSGCLAPASRLHALKAENQALSQRNQAQTSRIENLETHAKSVEDQLIQTEEQLAISDEQSELNERQLSNYRQERDQLHNRFMGLVGGAAPLSAEVRGQLAELSRRFPSLRIDPQSGAGKLDTDILFDTGRTDVKPGAEEVLAELVRVLNSDEGRDLKVMIVGHTDNQLVSGKPVREKYPTNFHLSSDRALAVFEQLRSNGLTENRIGVASFGSQQPIAPNVTAGDRQKNRRVELFVMAPEVPVIGWTESTPDLY